MSDLFQEDVPDQYNIGALGSAAEIKFDIEPLAFEEAFARSKSIRADRKAAKLLLIDQFGVSHVTDEIFDELINSGA